MQVPLVSDTTHASLLEYFNETAKTEVPYDNRCATIQTSPCSKAVSTKHTLKFCIPSLAIAESPYKRNILEREVNNRLKNKNTKIKWSIWIFFCVCAKRSAKLRKKRMQSIWKFYFQTLYKNQNFEKYNRSNTHWNVSVHHEFNTNSCNIQNQQYMNL